MIVLQNDTDLYMWMNVLGHVLCREICVFKNIIVYI